jgi:4-hydroxybenzoate polyprenyltransferase
MTATNANPMRPLDRALALGHALRPVQWSKNLLLAVPLLAAHHVRDMPKLLGLVAAIAAFCLAASAGYVINDLLDRESDRRHPTKCSRPFASGQVSAGVGLLAAVALLAGALALSLWRLPHRFTAVLALYMVLTMAYSIHLKRRLILDVMVLAGLYTLRIVAGGLATATPVSPWLLAFSMFFFLSLAFAKRYGELRLLGLRENEAVHGRGYMAEDLEIVRAVGPASGYLSVLVLGLYINLSTEVGQFYPRGGQILWLVCPLLLYWITRIWFLAQRGTLRDDPLTFALKDPISYLVGLCTVGLMYLASIWHWAL